MRSYVIKPAVTNYQTSTVVTTVGHPQQPQQIVVYEQDKISDSCVLVLIFIIALLLLFCVILFFMAIPMCAKVSPMSQCTTDCPGLWFPFLFFLYLAALVFVVNICKGKGSKIFGFVSYNYELIYYIL